MEKKRLITTVAAVALLGAFAIGGTLAYLTDTETKTNNFTLTDKVDIDLTEENWDEEDGKDITPNEIVAKDPVVVNKSAEDVIAFIELKSPKSSIQLKDQSAASVQELFWYYSGTTAPEEILSDNTWGTGWVLLETDTTSDDDNVIYLFGYNTKIAASETTGEGAEASTTYSKTNALFDFVQLKNYVNAAAPAANPTAADIIVTAYAIQADNLYTADGSSAISTTGTLSAATLSSIYDTYVADTADSVAP